MSTLDGLSDHGPWLRLGKSGAIGRRIVRSDEPLDPVLNQERIGPGACQDAEQALRRYARSRSVGPNVGLQNNQVANKLILIE